jgi:hypothetical protein
MSDQFVPKKKIGGRKIDCRGWIAASSSSLSIQDQPSGDAAGQLTIVMRLYVRGDRHKRPFAQRAITGMWRLGSGPDGSNSLWRFINSKAPLHAASFDFNSEVTSDPQEVANAFA